jgi:AcrR family transcriptional regulator
VAAGRATKSRPGPRRQGAATRDKLLTAAVPALAESGLHATRVDDVVRLAGVSHGTFYLYFSNMEDLFRALAVQCADECDELASKLGEVPDGDEGRIVLRTWLAEYLAFYRRYGVVIRAWAENQVLDRRLARLGTESFGRIAATLRSSIDAADGVSAGRRRSTRSAAARRTELRADALLAMIERFAYVATSRDLGYSDDQLVDDLSLLVQRAFFPA